MTIFSISTLCILLIINYFLYKKYFKNKPLLIIITLSLIYYYIFSLFIYNNNINLGFENGILYGNILENHFCDEFRYFTESNILYNHFINGDFTKWLTLELPRVEFFDINGHPGFGNYNIFVIILALFKLIGAHTAVDFITIKLFTVIITSIFLYKVSNIYLNRKLSLIPVLIFNFIPTNLLINSVLMRDNFIIMFIVILIYYLLSDKINYLMIGICMVGLLLFRAYLVPIILASIFFTYKNTNKLISLKDIVYIIVILITIVFFSSVPIQNEQLYLLRHQFAETYGTGYMSIFNLLKLTCIDLFTDPIFKDFLKSEYIYLILISLSNIVYIIFSILFILKFIYTTIFTSETKIVKLLKFTVYFTLLNSILLMSKDTFIVNRLTLMWLPLFTVILLLPLNKKFNFINK